MSLDLDVKITKEIKLSNLLADSRNEMIKLTNFKDVPDLQCFLLKEGVKVIPEDNYILKPNEVVIIKFQDIVDEISLIIVQIDYLPPYVTDDEVGVWAGISIQGDSSIKAFLALGIALYLADLCDSNIVDERMFWCNKRESSYNTFFDEFNNKESLRYIRRNSNFEEVCEIVLDKSCS